METPQDHRAPANSPQPMPTMLRPGRVDGKTIPFKFEHNGRQYELLPSSTLNVGFARRIRKLMQEDQIFTVLEALADEDTLKAIDDMGHEEFQRFQWAWQQHNSDEGIVSPLGE